MRHYNLWKEAPRPPPAGVAGPPVTDGSTLDYAFFSLLFLKRKASGVARLFFVPLSTELRMENPGFFNACIRSYGMAILRFDNYA
jgi:hypothetical protein